MRARACCCAPEGGAGSVPLLWLSLALPVVLLWGWAGGVCYS
jgi:hypothetical protein